MPHKDAVARAAYQAAYRLFHPTADDVRRAYQRDYYHANRPAMLAHAAARRAAKRAILPPVTVGLEAFLLAYCDHRPDAPARDAHRLWRALVAAAAPPLPPTQKDTP
jgi:hypothetical protein